MCICKYGRSGIANVVLLGAGKQVQFRPVLAGDNESSHAWSTCPSHSDRPINLQSLDEAQSCLATCKPASRRSSQGGAPYGRCSLAVCKHHCPCPVNTNAASLSLLRADSGA